MISIAEWFPLVVVGATFTIFGALKLYGYFAGIVGGHDKPIFQQACGT